MQTSTLFIFSLFAFAYALPVPFLNHTSTHISTRASSTVSATSLSTNNTTASNKKYVVAHHMIGNTFPYTSQDWLNDIKLAHASGIDGFALNMGSDIWQPARVADAYAAAQNSSLDFKMFFSLDMSILPCSTVNDATSLRALVTTYLSHPNQLRYSRGSSTQLPLVSTFAGESCKFGQASVADGWRTQFAQHLDLQGKMTFVPSFFVAPNQMSQFQGAVDGTFNWNGGWPIELTTDSTGSSSTSLSSTLKNLLGVNTTTNAIGKLSNLGLGENSSSTNASSGLLNLEDALSNFIGSTDSDSQFLDASSENNVYIAAVSPWFFTHFGKNSFNKNFLYLADQHLYSKRWESLIPAQVHSGDNSDTNSSNASSQPSISDQVDIVEIISWNDYGESHYVGPIEGALPTGSETWTNGMNHTAWLSLTSYYAAAFKNGSYPSISLNEERIVMWSRTHPASADATSDNVGRVPGSELVLDAMWAVTLLSEPANVTLQIIPFSSNSSTGSPLAQQTFSIPAGLSKITIPISVPDAMDSVSMRAVVERGDDDTVMDLDASSQGFEFVKTPQQFNFNAWVGCAGGGCVA